MCAPEAFTRPQNSPALSQMYEFRSDWGFSRDQRHLQGSAPGQFVKRLRRICSALCPSQVVAMDVRSNPSMGMLSPGMGELR